MNAWLDLDAAWQLAGWTMLHFLWIGALAALAGASVRLACRRAAPAVRYAASLGTLAVIVTSPLVIAAWLNAQPRAQSGGSVAAAVDWPATPGQSPGLKNDRDPVVIDLAKTPMGDDLVARGENLAPKSGPVPVAAIANPSPSPSLRGRGIVDAAVAYLPWLWLVGAPATFALLAAGLVGANRLRRTCTPLDAGPVAEACARLRALMHVAHNVAVAASDVVAQPVLVGIVRPTILLPAAALTGWTPEELEMVLLHELAHVRRWDNLVNLLQRLVESLLFFHPAVWLMSGQVRRDREECCDALVVRYTRRPEEYASLLVAIAAAFRPGPAPPFALGSAMAEHPLAGRVRRILKLEDEPMRISRNTLIISAALLVGVVVTLAGPLAIGNAENDHSAVADGAEDAAQTVPAHPSDNSTESRTLSIRVYPVADLNSVQFQDWMKLIASDAAISVRWFDTNKSLVISAPPNAHEQISEFLENARDRARAESAKVEFRERLFPTSPPVQTPGQWSMTVGDGSSHAGAAATVSAPNYLYDGKTFAQWRSLWQTELKPDGRAEAVEALAAFGHAGHGLEAAEAILDIAAQYNSPQNRASTGGSTVQS